MNEVLTNLCEVLSNKFDLGTGIVSLLQAQCVNGLCAVVCPDHLGDTFWAGAFSGEIKRQFGYQKILYVCKNVHEDMLKLFPDIDLTMTLEPEEMDAVQVFFYMHQKSREGDIFFSGFPFYIGFCYPVLQRIQMVPTTDGSLNGLFETFFGLTAPTTKSRIRVAIDGKEEEREKKYHRTVLISTGAYSVQPLPMGFWEKLVKVIRSKGYEIYVNDGGEDCDKMIDGVQSLSVTVPELVRIAPHLALFVGIRSGLCDVLAQTSVEMKVLFTGVHNRGTLDVTEQDMWTHNVYEMDRRESIKAFQYVAELEDLLIYKICEDLK